MKELLKIPLPDGSHTQISLFLPKESKADTLLLLFPAMGVEAAYYEPFATYLAQEGLLTITADLRGLGHSSIRPEKQRDYGYEEMMQLDYLSIFKSIDQKFPKKKKIVLGHSLGGQLAACFLSRYDFGVKTLILLAACSVHPSGWEGMGRLKIHFVIRFFGFIARVLGYFPGDKIGFGGRAAKQHLLDWCRQGKTGKYQLAKANFDYETALGRLKISTLAIPIANDQLAPAKAMKNLYQKFHPAAEVQVREFTPAQAGFDKPNHFNWARKPKGMGDLILTWLKEGV